MTRTQHRRHLLRMIRKHRHLAQEHERVARKFEKRLEHLEAGRLDKRSDLQITLEEVQIESTSWPSHLRQEVERRRQEIESQKTCQKKDCKNPASFQVSDGPHGLSPRTNEYRLCQVCVKNALGFENVRRL